MQYREAYALWIKKIVYAEDIDKINKKELCSKLESYSRETCELADFIFIVVVLMCITFVIIIYTLKKNIPLLSSSTNLNIAYASGALTVMLFLALPVILRYLKIDIIASSRTSSIDEKIFEVWYVNRCYRCKHEDYRNKLEPRRLYETLAEKIEKGDIKDVPQEDINLVKPLFRNRDYFSRP
ncbi:MAG TPA: hypothetical protein VIO58_05505 [Candidatus Methanoperedens sp.]